MATFRGTPRELDTFLEPAVRYTLFAVALPLVGVLWWFEAWWWIPAPLILAIVAHQVFFWSRGDRPADLVLDEHRITLEDARRGAPIHIEVADVSLASVYVRLGRLGEQAVVLLANDDGPLLGVQFLLTRRPQADHAVDIDEADRTLGGQAGVLRAVTPLDLAARQDFPRPSAVDWLLGHIPDAAWQRTGLRLWRGNAPPLSPFGYHFTDADAWLVLDGSAWTLRHRDGSVERGVLDTITCSGSHRTVEIVVRTDKGPQPENTRVDLLAVALSDTVVVSFPAPVAAPRAPQAARTDDGFHCHAPEGAALVAHLRQVLQATRLPEPLHP